MTGTKDDLVKYRIQRAKETFHDAEILADNERWNSALNRLYYASYYAVSALLLKHSLKPTTHTGAKNQFSEHFIKTNILTQEIGKLYSQLFSWRQKGDYDDLFDFNKERVLPYFKPVEDLIIRIEKII